ncbi:PREDICTED: histamine N-methyltransferase-like [Branchiostoma belcheri]|uniref:Histamine N-methyltransferase-like n=1 Tax=Branchiostoma belcheri TaxID=7741 RepID=A0A6P5AMH6_BRABE|nr:PREDICTED: histamine N-methyltransferase-like [Branchiostoma belcheri]
MAGQVALSVGMLSRRFPERYVAAWQIARAALEIKREDRQLSYASKVPDSIQCEPGAALRVLGIGSGSGEVDSAMLKKVLQRHKTVYNRVVEPSGEMLERYKTLVREDKSLGAVTFDWRQQTAEEYFQTKEDTKFHLVHAIQVLYNVEDHHATLRNMWEQVESGGYMLVAMESDHSDLGKLHYKLWDEFGQGDRLKTSLRSSGDVKQWLDARGISYVTWENINVNFNVTECFKEDSEAGKMLLDFLTLTPYVSSDTKIKSMVLDFIRCNSSLADGKVIFKASSDVVVAFRRK